MQPAKLIIFLFFFINVKGLCQEYNYHNYNVNDGLSGITVYTIAQDKDDFLWFGTETGLSRFDGNHFKNFSIADGLNASEIINLFVDSKNRIWIFPFKNSLFYYYHGKIFNESNDSLIKRIHLKNEIFKACEDKDGNIFFLEQNVVHILTKDNTLKEIKRIDGKSFYPDACGISTNGYCTLFISFLDEVSKHHILKYEYNGTEFIYKEAMDDHDLSRNHILISPYFTLIRDAADFEIFNQRTNEKFTVKIPMHFHTISYVNDSSFAISTFEKTFLYNINEKKIVDSFLINKIVNKCFKDNEDNFWFATMTDGVFRLSSTKFKIYNPVNQVMPAYSLSRYKQYLYIGSSKMLLWYINLQKNKLEKIKIGVDYNIGRVSAVLPLNDNKIILGTDDGIFTKNENSVLNFFPRTSVKAFFLHKDSLLIATDRYAFDGKINNLKYTDTIWQGRVTSVCKFNDQYYIGTLSNLYCLKNNNNHTKIDLGNNIPLLKERIVAIVPGLNNNLWIATGSSGVICLRNNKLVCQITTNNGLTSNSCRCLYIYNNNLWLGTDKGVCKIDVSNYPFKVTQFTAADGLDCEIINSIYAEGDSVFAGTPFGVTFFNSGKIANKSICELKLVGIQSKNTNWYYKKDSIYLLSRDNFLRFEYAAISFVSEGDINYYYQLIGLDSSWQSTKQNAIEFESLPAGNYTFNMYAVNKYGIKSNPITIHFSKAKTFWQLFWVRVLLVTFIACLIWLVIRERIKKIKKNANDKFLREKKMHEVEQMALRSQMNPHFIFNGLNSLQQYVFAGNVFEANQFITNFSSLIRQTLYISEKKFISLDDEINYLNTYLKIEQTKYENVFDYSINKDENLIAEIVLVPPLLLQPYVENSIRHGILNMQERRGKILVSFKIEDDYLKCTIEDNGIGREKAIKIKNSSYSNHRSKGMELVEKRIKSLNNIYNVKIVVLVEDVDEKNQWGTSVIIKLPLSYGE